MFHNFVSQEESFHDPTIFRVAFLFLSCVPQTAKDSFSWHGPGHSKTWKSFFKSYVPNLLHSCASHQRRSMRRVSLLFNTHMKNSVSTSVSTSRMHTKLLALGITLHVLTALQCVSARVVPTRSVAFHPSCESPRNAWHSGIAIPRNPELLL
jgi:hypothetical protein